MFLRRKQHWQGQGPQHNPRALTCKVGTLKKTFVLLGSKTPKSQRWPPIWSKLEKLRRENAFKSVFFGQYLYKVDHRPPCDGQEETGSKFSSFFCSRAKPLSRFRQNNSHTPHMEVILVLISHFKISIFCSKLQNHHYLAPEVDDIDDEGDHHCSDHRSKICHSWINLADDNTEKRLVIKLAICSKC